MPNRSAGIPRSCVLWPASFATSYALIGRGPALHNTEKSMVRLVPRASPHATPPPEPSGPLTSSPSAQGLSHLLLSQTRANSTMQTTVLHRACQACINWGHLSPALPGTTLLWEQQVAQTSPQYPCVPSILLSQALHRCVHGHLTSTSYSVLGLGLNGPSSEKPSLGSPVTWSRYPVLLFCLSSRLQFK